MKKTQTPQQKQQQGEIKKKQQSDSSRFVGLVQGNSQKKSEQAFSFCKVLLRTCAHAAQSKVITPGEWKQIHGIVLVAIKQQYNLEEQKALQELVSKADADIAQHQNASDDSNVATERNKLTVHFQGASKQGVINQSQVDALCKLINNQGDQTEEEEVDTAMEEMKIVMSVYGEDYSYANSDFEDRANGFSHSCSIVCRPFKFRQYPQAAWVKVQFKFGVEYPATPVKINLVDSYKCRMAELVILESLLVTEAQKLATNSKLAVQELAAFVADYLDNYAKDKIPQEAAKSDLPFIPKNYKLTEMAPQPASTECVNMSLADLDKTLCLAVNEEVRKHNSIKNVTNTFEIGYIETAFKSFKEKLIEFNSRANKGENYLPVVLYHGTCSATNVASIARNGLVGAYNYTNDGKFINVTHGSVFGIGIYASPFIGHAAMYACMDALQSSQLFVSLALLGKPYRFKDMEEVWENGSVCRSMWPMPGYDSHISPNGGQVVLFESAQIMPVLLVTLNKPGTPSLEQRMKKQLDMSGTPKMKAKKGMAKWKILKQEIEKAKEIARAPKSERGYNDLVMYRVPGSTDLWALPIKPDQVHDMDGKTIDPEVHLQQTFVIDKSESMGSTFSKVALPACAHLFQSIAPTTCNVVLFGRTIDTFHADKIISANFFESRAIVNTKLEDATDIIGGFKKALDISLGAQESIIRNDEDNYYNKIKAYLDTKKSAENTKANELAERKGLDTEELDLSMTGKEIASIKRQYERSFEAKKGNHIIVMLSDGEDTVNNSETIEKTLLDYYNMIKGSQLRTIFKVVGIGKNSDTHLAMRMKLAAQSCKIWESTPVHYVRRAASLPVVMQTLSDELKQVINQFTSVDLQAIDFVHGDGFISNLTQPPTPFIPARLHPTKQTCLLFKGVPPRELALNTEQWWWNSKPVYLLDKPEFDEVQMQSSILELLGTLVADIKVAIVAGREVTKAINEVRSIVTGVKEANFDEKKLVGTTPAKRIEIMKNKRRLVVELQEILNTLEDTINLGNSKMSSDQQAVWLNQATNMKYGAQALRRAAKTKVDIKEITDGLKLIKQNAEEGKFQELATDPKSCISGLTAVGHLKEISSNPPTSFSITDLLYSYGITGVGIRVARSEASNIDPWKIAVQYISKDWWDTTSAMCGLHAMATHNDTSGKTVQDVLVLLDPRNPTPYTAFVKNALHRAYLGVVFARNPDIQLPAQRSALLMSSLVRGITQLLEPAFRTRPYIAMLFRVIYTIRKSVLNSAVAQDYWDQVLKKLTMSQPGKWMTEAPEDDIGSVAKLLGALCSNIEKVRALNLFGSAKENKEQLAEVSLALLAETSSRGARGKIKGIIEKQRLKDLTAKPPMATSVVHSLLMDALGLTDKCRHPDPSLEIIDPPVTSHDASWNLDRAKKASGNFFFNTPNNNCPPQSVLACLTFASAAVNDHKFDDLDNLLATADEDTLNNLYDSIIQAFEGVTMRTFIERYICFDGSSNLVGSTPVDLQVALYVQGTKFYNSQTRRLGLPSLSAPKGVIEGIAEGERAIEYEKELAVKNRKISSLNAENAQRIARAEKLRKQAVFLATHQGIPRIFGYGEVAELNRHRAANDQLERMDNGLLKHHCCFPNCPEYLHNFASEKDLILNRRHGLYKHMKLFSKPANYYIKSFHLAASSYLRRHQSATLAEFMQVMKKDTPCEHTAATDMPQKLEALYHAYKEFYKEH